MRFAYVNMIPATLLQAIWQTHFAPYQFPNVTAYHVTAQQLIAFVQMLRGVSATYIDTRVIEYGEWIADDEICAFTAYNVHRNAFLVLRRIDSRSTLDEDLRHELRHVYDQIVILNRNFKKKAYADCENGELAPRTQLDARRPRKRHRDGSVTHRCTAPAIHASLRHVWCVSRRFRHRKR